MEAAVAVLLAATARYGQAHRLTIEAEKELAEDPLAEEAGPGLGQLRMAFGPFLSLATLEFLLVGRDLMGAYLSWMAPAL